MAAIHDNTIEFYAPLNLAESKVDRDEGMIRGVSVITGNLTAIGHDLDVDDTTLEQIELQGKERKKVPVKVNHKSGVEAVCGHLVNFRRKGGKVLADWKLLKKHSQYETIMEAAEVQPETVGLSVSFAGPEEPCVIGGRTKARCEKLLSTDYVIHPAANPDGLFQSKQVDNQPKTKMSDQNNEPTLTDLMEAVKGLTEKVESQGQFIEGLQSEQAQAEALQIAGLTAEQAEELGIDAEDLQAAQDFIAENYGEEALQQITQETQAELTGEGGEGEGEGEGAEGAQAHGTAEGEGQGGEGAGAGASAPAATAMSAQFKNLQNAVTNLTSKMEAQELSAERNRIDMEAKAIEDHITDLEAKAEKLTELEAENKNLRKALNGAGRKPVLTQFSEAGLPVNEDENAFESKVAKRITELKSKNEKMTDVQAKAQAWRELKAEDPDGFIEFQAQGGGKTTTL